MSESHLDNVPLAFLLTGMASLSTTIGAAAAFVATLHSRLVLAGSLGLSAGVMIYVSFVEIFVEAKAEFEHYQSENDLHKSLPLLLSTVFFFVGMIVVTIIDQIVHFLEDQADVSEKPHLPTMHMDAVLEHHAEKLSAAKSKLDSTVSVELEDQHDNSTIEANVVKKMIAENDTSLRKASLITAMAVSLHNIPEGLATFVATLADPKVGISVSIAIAIHNIPEGLCVAMPLFFSTGSRWKAFLWATASGVSEFLGAVIGFTVLRSVFSSFVYGVVFGVVSGMMVFVSFRELLPVARRYDPEDRIVSWSLVAGMGVMALSLVLFEL